MTVKILTKMFNFVYNYWISFLYLETPKGMHSNKYKHAYYWLSNLWELKKWEKESILVHVYVNGCVLRVKSQHRDGEDKEREKALANVLIKMQFDSISASQPGTMPAYGTYCHVPFSHVLIHDWIKCVRVSQIINPKHADICFIIPKLFTLKIL